MLSEYAPAVAGRPGQSVLDGEGSAVLVIGEVGLVEAVGAATRVSTMRQGAMATKGRGEEGNDSA